MADENKKEEATNPAQPSEEKVEGQEPEKGTQPEPFDYKAELEKVSAQINYRLRKLEKVKEEGVDEGAEGEESSQESVADLVKKEASRLFGTQTESQAKNYARSIASNQDEADLIIYHYKNTLSLTGDVEKDIKRAKLIANESRIEKDIEQLRRANQSKESMGNAGGDGGQKTQEDKIPLDKESQSFLISQGFTRDSKRKGWVSKSGRFVSDEEASKSVTQ